MSLSAKSEEKLSTCCHTLANVVRAVSKMMNISVLCCHRCKEEQNMAYNSGHSKVKWPGSKHNLTISMAVDIVPVPVDWNNMKRFYYMAGLMMGIADERGIQLTWGGDWDRDCDFADNKFNDLCHFEIKEE